MPVSFNVRVEQGVTTFEMEPDQLLKFMTEVGGTVTVKNSSDQAVTTEVTNPPAPVVDQMERPLSLAQRAQKRLAETTGLEPAERSNVGKGQKTRAVVGNRLVSTDTKPLETNSPAGLVKSGQTKSGEPIEVRIVEDKSPKKPLNAPTRAGKFLARTLGRLTLVAGTGGGLLGGAAFVARHLFPQAVHTALASFGLVGLLGPQGLALGAAAALGGIALAAFIGGRVLLRAGALPKDD